MSRGTALAALGLAGLIGGTVALGINYPERLTSTALAQPQAAEVAERTLVCPSVGGSEGAEEAVTVFRGTDTGGAADASGEVTGGAAGAAPLPPPGGAAQIAPAPSGGPVKVVTAGSGASGTALVRSLLDRADERRGLAMTTCPQPDSEWWFVGVSAETGHIDELLLANPTESPAVVTIDVFGSTGPIDVVGAGGLVLLPGEESVTRVDSLVPGAVDATLRVSTSGGLVAAAVRSTDIDGLIPRGADFLPPAVAPDTTVIVPGVLAGPGPRRLLLTAGDRDAAVRVELLTGGGPVLRSGGGQIPVPAGTTVAVNLSQDLQGDAAAVVVQSSAPVTAAVESVQEGTLPADATGVLFRVPVADTAWTAAQAPIEGRWLLPLAGVAEAPGGLLLVSEGGPANVDIAVRSASGEGLELRLDLPADQLRDVPLPITPGAASIVELSVTGPGSVRAATYQVGALEDGPIATAAIGFDATTEVVVPLAYPDPQVLTGP